MARFTIRYDGKLIGEEFAETIAEALAKVTARNPCHVAEKFTASPAPAFKGEKK